MSRRDHDDATDRLLNRLVGLVVLGAAGTLLVAGAWLVPRGPVDASVLATVAILIPLTTVASLATARVRVRASMQTFSWTGTAILVSIAMVPLPWAILATAAGVAIAKALTRIAPIKIAFNTAKDTIVVTAAGLALLALDVTGPLRRPLDQLGALALAYLAGVVVDEVLAIPIIAIATRTSIRQRFQANADLRLALHGMEFGVALVALAALQQDRKLLIALPPLVWLLHMTNSNWVRARAEREAWRRLAQATDELNVVKLDTVLTTALSRAGQLFSADEVEIEVHGSAPRLVRGAADRIVFDGDPADAPSSSGSVITSPLEGRDDEAGDIGVLRLRFRGPVALTERERYTLSTFASALCTAIRNASAYDMLARIADEHAHAAAHDALTGLANRRHLFERGNALLDQHNSASTALLLVDLDHFKEINDTLGHAAGDRVLMQVADRLRTAAADGDLVARLGGDEFAVLINGLPAPALAAHRAQRVLATLHEPLDIDGMRISIEASGGVAVAPGSGGVAELLRRADVAMYHAKRSGQRLGTYSPSRDSANAGRLALGGDTSRPDAGHEFIVAFQPIVDLATGEVVAAEALPRWLHSDHGTADPLRILESVEQSGLLPAFAEAVLDRSLTAVRAWREAGFDLPVSVNVSPRSLLDPRFPGSVLARLRAHDVAPDRLFLELTETLTISQLEVVDQVLNQLRDEGVRLALDDFGTGYSSLSVLSRIPVHELKIDPAFVTAMETAAEASAVIRSTVDLARSLDLTVVADGVESEPQRRTLWEAGCAAGQGPLFARPMPAARLIAALRRGSGGRPGTLAPPLHDEGAVIRLPSSRRPNGRAKTDRLPHLPA